MAVFERGLVLSGLLLGSCLSPAAGPEGHVAVPIPAIDAEAPEVFETATFALG